MDCKAFALLLDLPDVQRGSASCREIFQMPAVATPTSGKDVLRCLRFSNEVLGWYAEVTGLQSPVRYAREERINAA